MTDTKSKTPLLIGVVIVLAVVGAFYTFRSSDDGATAKPEVTQTQPADTTAETDTDGN